MNVRRPAIHLGDRVTGGEMTPTDVDTIADLQGFAPVLKGAGYSDHDVNGILHGNALRRFREAWSSRQTT